MIIKITRLELNRLITALREAIETGESLMEANEKRFEEGYLPGFNFAKCKKTIMNYAELRDKLRETL